MQARPWYLISFLGILDGKTQVGCVGVCGVITAFAGSLISIILSHDEFELNTVPGSGSSWPSNYQATV